VVEEHFFSSHLRNKLGARIHHRSRRTSAQRLILACLEGEQHEIGALLFALSAADRAFRLIYLGADVPIDELVGVQDKTRSNGIVLAGTTEPTEYDLGVKLGSLVERVEVPVFVGGRVCSYSRAAIESSGAILLGADLASAFKAIESQLGAD
jgi:methanogenic corrinoid protein MtbC1